MLARAMEREIMEAANDTVLVLMKASPEVITRRMKESPHTPGLVQEKDIEHMLQRFEEEYSRTLLRRKFELDTTTATVQETLAEFGEKVMPTLTDRDRLRLLVHQGSRGSRGAGEGQREALRADTPVRPYHGPRLFPRCPARCNVGAPGCSPRTGTPLTPPSG